MSPVMGKKLGKSEKSSLAGVDFGDFPQGCGGVSKEKGAKRPCSGYLQPSALLLPCARPDARHNMAQGATEHGIADVFLDETH